MRFRTALLLLLASTTASSAAPNIVVIMTDDQDDTGSIGYMPKLHALLAEQGVTFTNSFVDVPLCAPSRASFLTGQCAHNNGIRANSPLDNGGWEGFKSKEDNVLPVWLKAAGYKTALVGKYLNRYGQQSSWGAWLAWAGAYLNIQFKGTTIGNPRDWVPPGWDLWFAFTGTRARYFDYAINANGTILNFGDRPNDYSTDVVKDRAVRFILDQSAQPDPFFMLIATKAVHEQGERAIPAPRHARALQDVKLPLTTTSDKPLKSPRLASVTRDDLELSYRAALQTLQSVDDLVEAVVDALKSAGKLDDTVIVYTSDNGFLFGQHRLVGKAAPYEEAIKVPLLMRGPGIPKNETRGQLVNNLDVVATILELAGASPGVALDGRSLSSLFGDADAPWRTALLIQSPVNRFQVLSDRFSGIRTATRKYVKYDSGTEKLYDLSIDPRERKNKARNRSYADDLAALRRLHDALKSCAGDACWVP